MILIWTRVLLAVYLELRIKAMKIKKPPGTLTHIVKILKGKQSKVKKRSFGEIFLD